MPDVVHGKRHMLRGWRALVGVCALVVLFAVVDARVKNAGAGPGYCPAGATCIVTARNFGAFWSAVARTDTVAQMKTEWPRPFGDQELAVRKAAGIRPTPTRWRLWMGYRLLAARANEGSGICVYPGLLLRAADWVRRQAASRVTEDGVYTFGDCFYGWRDGFLVVSPSRDYVAASLTAPAPVVEASSDAAEIALQWSGTPDGLLRIRAEDALPVAGRLHVAFTPRNGPLTLTGAWPTPPLIALSAAKWDDILALVNSAAEPVRRTDGWSYADTILRLLWHRWGLDALPAGWDRPVDHCALAIADVDVASPIPAPRLAAVFRCARPPRGARHPWEPVVSPLTTFPYEWQDSEGLIAPLAGERLTLCLGRSELDWIVTSDEPLMSVLAGSLGKGDAPEADAAETDVSETDAALRVDLQNLGRTAERLLEKAGELELIQGMNRDDVRFELLPIARGIARLGTLELNGAVDGEWLNIRGYLARPANKAAS